MNRKKIFTMLLSISLSVFIMSGCGAAQSTATSGSAQTKKSQTKFTLFYNQITSPVDISKTAVGKQITKITGTTFDTSYLVGSNSATKSGVMIASGEYPDLISLDAGDVDTFINAGAVIPLDSYIKKYGTNIKKVYGTDLKKLVNPTDGHIYSLTPFRASPTALYPASGFYLANDVLQQAGYPKVTNLTQYFKLIKDYLAKNPTFNGQPNIGFTSNAIQDNYTISGTGSLLAGHPNTGGWNLDGNETHDFSLASFTKSYLQVLNTMWNENIVDKQMFIDNNDAFQAKVASGRVLGLYDGRWDIQSGITSLEQQKLFSKVPFAMPVLDNGVTKDAYNGVISIGTVGGIYITKSCKDPVAAFKLLDEMASDKIQKLQNWGIEGVDYTVKDGKMTQTAAQSAKLADPQYVLKTGVGSLWFFPHSDAGKNAKYADGNFVSPEDAPEYIASKYQPYEKVVMAAYKLKNLNDMFAPAINSDFGYGWDIAVPDSQPVVKVAQQKENGLQQSYMAKLVMAKPSTFQSVWTSYSSDMKAINYNVGDAYYTKEVQYRIKNWK